MCPHPVAEGHRLSCHWKSPTLTENWVHWWRKQDLKQHLHSLPKAVIDRLRKSNALLTGHHEQNANGSIYLIVFYFTHHYCPPAMKCFQHAFLLINNNDPSRNPLHDFHKDWSFSVAQAHDTCKHIRQLRSCPQGIIWGFLTSVFIQLQQSQEWSIWWLSNGIYGFVS